MSLKEKYNLTIGFDGKGLKEHKIDAVDLSISLAGFNDLLEFSNKVLNSDDVKMKIQVSSNFKEGSFNILMELSQSISGFFSGIDVTNILVQIGLINGFTGINLLELFRFLKNKKIVKQENRDNLVIVYLEDGSKIEITKEIAKLMSIKEVRKAIAVMLNPLQKDGIDEFYTSKNGTQKEQVITKGEIETFAYTEEQEKEELFHISTNQMVCKIIGIVFEEGLKWRLADENNKFYAVVLDNDFLKRIENREISFSKGDLLKAEIEVKTFKLKDDLRKEYVVRKVIEVITPIQQGFLF